MGKCYKMTGGRTLSGQINIQGSKNAALPVIAATVLCQGVVILEHVPEISDVEGMLQILECMGAKIRREKGRIEIDNTSLDSCALPYDLTGGMRCSVVLLGALLGRFQRASIGLPGGCVIGERPIDYHLEGLRRLGVTVDVHEDYLDSTVKRLEGSKVVLPFPSVGATENLILAAVLAEGTTVLEGSACEPEIVELCQFLTALGAKIKGIGTETVSVIGVKPQELKKELRWRIGGDRIAAATYLTAPIICGGEVTVQGIDPWLLSNMTPVWMRMGARVRTGSDLITLTAPQSRKAIDYLCTKPHPGFPTDMQSVMLVALSLAEGTSVIEETIFENRFSVAEELKKCGARLKITGRRVMIEGVKRLQAAELTAGDLRSGAALVLAGLAAEGESTVFGIDYLERGYECFAQSLKRLGADITSTEQSA